MKKIKNLKGFTLVEMAVTLVVIIILMSVSVPIYKNNTKNFKLAEGYALLATIRSAQERYYAEYGNFLLSNIGSGGTGVAVGGAYWTTNEEVLGINARTNKYFTLFCINGNISNFFDSEGVYDYNGTKRLFKATVQGTAGRIGLKYSIEDGVTYIVD